MYESKEEDDHLLELYEKNKKKENYRNLSISFANLFISPIVACGAVLAFSFIGAFSEDLLIKGVSTVIIYLIWPYLIISFIWFIICLIKYLLKK